MKDEKIYLNEDAYGWLLFMVGECAEIEEESIREQLIEGGADPEICVCGGDYRAFEGYLESLPGGNQVYEIEDYLVEGVLDLLRDAECKEGEDWYIVDRVTEDVTKDK